MGSKKHKKESKKKKHRSRSRSPLDNEERERKRHKKHKDRKKDRSPDVEEVPVDSHLEPARRSSSAERDRRQRAERHRERDRERSVEPEISSVPVASGSNQESLSIEETNRLRIKLGLKPLEVADQAPADDGKLKDDLGEFYHKPAGNIAQQQKADKLREKLQTRRDKRKLEQKLQTASLLADGEDDEDAMAWIKKSREIEKQKQEAAKRAALLDEMDEVFGVSALVAEEGRRARDAAYGADSLKGLRVAHDLNSLGEEREVVLTLADKPVLAEDAEDVLVNVNIVDDDKYKKNIIERKKAKAGYMAYDDEADLEAAALGFQKPVLSKYDEEIDKEKAQREKGFIIGDKDGLEAMKFREAMIRERQQGSVEKRLESLQLPPLRLASDYFDEHEMEAKFKKVKKKGKLRRRAKAEPIDVEQYDPSAVPLDTDDTELPGARVELPVDEDELEVDGELQGALERARRLRQAHAVRSVPKVEEILQSVKEEEPAVKEEPTEGTMVLDATAEFCRTLGDIPTYGLAGNREHAAEIMDFERTEAEAEAEAEAAEAAGAWSRVDLQTEQPPDLAAGSGLALGAEPALGAGVAGALRLALSKGYLERAPPPRAAATSAALLAHHYSIEDKTYGEDDKHGRRERGYSGPVQEFREKSHFKPAIKLEYVDDDGRPLCPKEAFRYLSHKFHGKGPGKNKQEKRIKKAVQEGLMKKMSSTDTPLGTLALLQEKQKETHSPFVVLSGTKREPRL